MSLATRCPSCATVFRVAEDQLRVSEGFVRCGRCDAVFNAREQLFDLESGQAASSSPTPAFHELPQQAPSADPSEPDTEYPDTEGFAPTQGPIDEADASAYREAHADVAISAPQEPGLPPIDGRREPGFEANEDGEWAATVVDPNERLRELLGAGAAAAKPEDADATTAGRPVESFASLRQSAAPPRTGLRRALAWLSLGLMAVALPLQWAWTERDALRARWAWADAAWQQVCTECDPVAWKRLDGLIVAASGLQPTPQGQAYHLSLRIENRSTHSLAVPWVDLRLNDADGKLLVRRSLQPSDLGSPAQRIEAGANLDLGATFNLPGRLAGYEISLFHP